MRLLVLLLVGAIGALVAAYGLPRGGRTARVAGLVGALALAGVTVAAFLQRNVRVTDAGQPLTGIFDAHLVGTEYLRLIVGLWGLESLVLVAMAWLLGGLPRVAGLLPATLAAMTGGTVALASADLGVGAAAAAATGLASLIVVLRAEGPAAVAAGARELRVTLLTGTVVIVAMAIVPLAARLAFIASGVGLDEETTAASSVAGPALGLVTIAVGLAIAARWGMLPFHVRVSRLTDIVPPETLPLLLAWTAVPLTVVTFAAVDRLITPLALPLDGERAVLLALAFLTLGGAALAAFFQDDLRHAVGYLVIADAGLLLLAIAALSPDAWGDGRAWVLALAASKTALGAWAAVAEDRFETRSIPDLRGWIRRSPLLAAALALTAVATFGLPGWVALDARIGLAMPGSEGAWGSPWRELLLVGGFLTLPTYLRLARVGIGRVTSRVDRAAPERIVRRRKPLETLPVEQEGALVPAPGAAGATGRGPALLARAAGAASSVASSARGVAGRTRTTTGAGAADGGVAGRGDAATGGSTPTPSADGNVEPGTTATTPRRPRRGAGDAGAWARASAAGGRFTAILRRDRTELLSAAVLTLAILAALTSWGALDLAGAAAEPAPILLSGASD